ncbi:MAG: hypothetical protein RR272_02970 [Synergistaceae bacterium]
MHNISKLIYSNLKSFSSLESHTLSKEDSFFILLNDYKDFLLDSAECCSFTLVDKSDLQSIAPGVISCAEKFGFISNIIFVPFFKDDDVVFLDITEDNFSSYLSYVSALFSICKCAVPYMLGTDCAKIIVPIEKDPVGVSRCMYKASILSMVQEMRKEFEMYNVSVETPFYSNSLDLADFI